VDVREKKKKNYYRSELLFAVEKVQIECAQIIKSFDNSITVEKIIVLNYCLPILKASVAKWVIPNQSVEYVRRRLIILC
jgi:hypothetical protein